jgi:predicted component of type VI protein secretion system
MKAELVPDNGDPPIPIIRDVTTVGRREFCDIRIDDPSLSKRHCVLVKTDGLLLIRDLASTNGTKVKGQRIRWAALLPDDRITLGSYKMRVYLGPDDVPGPSEIPRGARRPSTTAGAARPAGPPPPPQLPPVAEFDDGDLPDVASFAAPMPVGAPALKGADLWEEDHGADDDSGWRDKLRVDMGDDMIIDLD